MRKTLTASEKRFLQRARVCRVGSIAEDGRPHVAPLCHAMDGRTLYVTTDREGRTATNLRRRSRATVACDEYFEDWDKIRGVIVQTRARRIERGPELKRAQRALARKFKQYKDAEIDYVIAFQIERAMSWGL